MKRHVVKVTCVICVSVQGPMYAKPHETACVIQLSLVVFVQGPMYAKPHETVCVIQLSLVQSMDIND